MLSVQRHNLNSINFPTGELVLEAQLWRDELSVWLQGRPDDVAVVRVRADYGTLRVRPVDWGTDMPVQFDGEY